MGPARPRRSREGIQVLDRSWLRRRRSAWANPGWPLCAAGAVSVVLVASAGRVLPGLTEGVLATQAVLSVSMFARSRAAAGRVRLRLRLMAASAVCGAAHEVLTGLVTSAAGTPDKASSREYGLVVLAAIAVAAGTAVAGMVVAAESGEGALRWARRLLDGVMIAGSLFTLGWTVLWRRVADLGDTVLVGATAAGYSLTQILLLGLLVGLWFAVRREERTTVTVAVGAMLLMVAGDTVYLWPVAPDAPWPGPVAAGCRMAGLLIAAAAPWTRGGGSLLEAGRREPAVRGVVAALVPFTICVACTAVQVLAWNRLDPVTVAVSASVLLALGVRQGVTQADNLRLIRNAAAREAHFRFLVQESSDAIMIAGPDGVLRYVSPAVHNVLGHRHEDLLGMSLETLTHPEDRTSLVCVAHGARGGGGPANGAVDHISCRMRAADGQWRHIESAVSAHADGVILSSRDVTARAVLQSRLEHLAYHDALTDLPNRTLFAERVNQALRVRSSAVDPPTVLFMDLDGFKTVNDTAGHAAGDEVLIQAAHRLKNAVEAGDTVARLGGDEFAALLGEKGGRSEGQARDIAERLVLALSQPYRVGGSEVTVAASIGMAVAAPGMTTDELLREADLAMYSAKAAGKGRLVTARHERSVPNQFA